MSSNFSVVSYEMPACPSISNCEFPSLIKPVLPILNNCVFGSNAFYTYSFVPSAVPNLYLQYMLIIEDFSTPINSKETGFSFENWNNRPLYFYPLEPIDIFAFGSYPQTEVSNCHYSELSIEFKTLSGSLLDLDQLDEHCTTLSDEELYCSSNDKSFTNSCNTSLSCDSLLNEPELELIVVEEEVDNFEIVHTISEISNSRNIHTNRKITNCLLECNYCKKNHKTLANLKSHLRVHTGVRPYKCLYCDLTFKQTSHLSSHTKRHTGEHSFICWYCNHSFIQRTALKSHIKNKHVNSKIKSTTTRKVQSKIKNFYCKFCDKTYIRVCKIDHMRNFHKYRDEGFVCQICNKILKKQSSYENHIKIHVPVYGEVFGFEGKNQSEFPDISEITQEKKNEKSEENTSKLSTTSILCLPKKNLNLNLNQRIHGGEKPYKCNVCQTHFRQISHLKDHYKRHTGQRPYSCSLCKRKFSRRSSASTHVLKHLNDKAFVDVEDEDKENTIPH